ncbi:hypothetical protein ACEWY4_011597 [Coilia grayii]|uniref:Taste receptor type 2 n=1 Tax=Coilia grayii TaxID=363190 RepID=A0ABD1JY65_9TELE
MQLSRAQRVAVWCLTGTVAVFTVFLHSLILLLSRRRARSSQQGAPCETITVALSLQSVLQQAVALLWMGLVTLDPWCMLGGAYPALVVLLLALRFSVLWSTAFLIFYYATKLVLAPVHCYTRAQQLILRHVRPAVLLIPSAGLALCCPLLGPALHAARRAANASQAGDCDSFAPPHLPGHAYLLLFLLLCDVLPGVVMLKGSISIAVHLALHLRHLRSSTNAFHAPKLGGELRVIRMALALAAVYLCFLAVALYTHYMIWQRHEHVFFLTVIFSSLYSALCGLALLYGKESFWKELLHLYNRTLDRYPCLTCLKVSEQTQDPGQVPLPHLPQGV